MQPELYFNFHKRHSLDCNLSYWIRIRDSSIVYSYSGCNFPPSYFDVSYFHVVLQGKLQVIHTYLP
jgi:hypothetical protein